MVLCLPLSHEGSPLNTLFSFQPYHRKNSSFEMIVTRLPQLLLESMKYSGGKKKLTKDLNVHAKSINSQNRIYGKSSWPSIWQYFLKRGIKTTHNKRKKREMDFLKIKNFYAAKNIIKKRYLTEWEKIFANHIYLTCECSLVSDSLRPYEL